MEIGFVSKLVNLEGPETDLLEVVVKAGGASSYDTRGLICSYPADTTRTHLCLDSPWRDSKGTIHARSWAFHIRLSS